MCGMTSSLSSAACYDEERPQSSSLESSDTLSLPQSETSVPPPATSTRQPSLFSPTSHYSPPQLALPSSEATQSQVLPGLSLRGATAAQPDSNRVEAVKDAASELQDHFVEVITSTRMNFSKKPKEFLDDLKAFLTELPISNKFKRLHFLKEEEQAIESAKSIGDIFRILRHHWNYGDYALLQRMIQKFGDKTLQNEMKEYVEKLRRFEKGTTIQEFSLAKPVAQSVPDHFHEAILELNIDPSKCTLHEIRLLAESLKTKIDINQYALFLSAVFPGSVIIKLAFPLAVLELIVSALDEEFQKTHQIVFVTIDKEPLKEYTEKYTEKVCVYMYIHFTFPLNYMPVSLYIHVHG